VGKFLRLFTELPLDEIARLEALEGAQINDAKKVLADQVTALCHGAAAAETARTTAEKTFEQGALSADLPTVEVPAADLEAGIALLDLLTAASFAASKGEARRLVRGGGVKVNDEKAADENAIIGADALSDGVVKLSAGKKRHALIKPV
jgi:tyrosyl-tRNA synthetase